MPLSPGQQLGSFEIVSALGAGGMGEVYRARDTRLGREVALKILPPDVTNEPGRLERFDREARAIAALNHPHIVTIYSTEEADGIRFLTMELVDGCTLSDLVMSSGMAMPRFLEIAIPLADALAAAHQKQITHRDLKPGNVMVSNDGRVKVLDFGLARVGGADAGEHSMIATQAPITHQGTIVGTMPYMSPEQVEGRPLDARSDLFSLGVIFYELLSGDRPFKGSSSPALMSAILRDTPSHIADKRSDVPEAIDRLISRLLEKRPEDRLQTARDVFNELRHIRGERSTGVQRKGSDRATADNLRIAVLPFTVRGADADADAIASALTDDIAASLAKFPGLSVVASQTTRAFKDSPLDVRQIAERVGARYVVTGNVRKAGTTLRTTAQVIDAGGGEQLWIENYERKLDSGDLFAVQDDLTDHIVATVADKYGVLARSMVHSVNQAGSVRDMTPAQLLVRAWGFQHQPLPVAHAEIRDAIEARLEEDPNNAHMWAELASLCVVEHSLWCNPRPDPLGRAQRAARRAIEIDRGNQSGWLWLALANFHQHDRAGFDEASERAIRINPRNASALAWIGNIRTHMGEYERGCAMTERAMTVNPAHPGWLHFAVFNRHFAAGEYEQALQAARRVNMRDFFWMHFAIAAACGHLGRTAEGKAACDAMVRIAPPLGDKAHLREFVSRWYWSEEMIETFFEGVLRSFAGGFTDVPQSGGSSASVPKSKPPSSTSGSPGGRSLTVAVLPFVPRSSDDDSKTLADGLTDDITSGLSRFGYLRVLSRSSVERLAREHASVHTHARYAIEGQVRKSGSTIRVGITLVDTQTGTNLWTSNFDGDAAAGTFVLQDEVARATVTTVGDHTGVLVCAMAAAFADKPLDQLNVDELMVRFHLYSESFRANEHLRLRDAFEAALKREPRSAEGWGRLAMLYDHERSLGFNPLPDPLGRQRRAAERAIELDPRSQQAWMAMASSYGSSRDLEGLKDAVERAVRINPLNSDIVAACAVCLSLAGELDRSSALVQQSLRHKPQPPGWYHFPMATVYFRRGDYEAALREIKAVNMPKMPAAQVSAASISGFLGKATEARAALAALRDINPALLEPGVTREFVAMSIWDDTVIEQLMEGFKKAIKLTEERSDVRSDAGLDGRSGLRSGITVTIRPFVSSGDEPARAIADALSSDLQAALARFSYVRVVEPSATAGARYALEGAVRITGTVARIHAHLVDLPSGEHVWTDSYTRDASAGAMALVDEVAGIIAATTGDVHGAIFRAFATSATDPRDAAQLQLLLGVIVYNKNHTVEAHAALGKQLRAVVVAEPDNARAWAYLAIFCVHEVIFGFNEAPHAVARAEQAIERSMAIDATLQTVWIARALVAFVKRDATSLRAAISRSIEINPLHTGTLANAGSLLAWSGDSAGGATFLRRAIALNPNHPGWYRAGLFLDAFARGADAEAFDECKRLTMPDTIPSLFALAAAGRFGRPAEATVAIAELTRRSPELLDSRRASDVFRRFMWDGPILDSLIDGFDKALALTDASSSSGAPSKPPSSMSGTSSQGGALSVAVLPFVPRSSDEESKALADGLTDDITSGLSRFGYLRVLSRSITERLAREHTSIHTQARYAIEGNVRKAGSAIRVGVTLVDTQTGTNLWTNNFDRDATTGTFVLQDEVASATVTTIGDQTGLLVRAMAASFADKPLDQLSVAELVVRYHLYAESFRADEHGRLRDAFDAALTREPRSAEGWACLAMLYEHEHGFGFNPLPDPLVRQRRAAERAIELDSRSQQAWLAMASSYGFSRDLEGLKDAVERAVAINPLNADLVAACAVFLSLAGELDRASAIVQQAIKHKPQHPGWYHFPMFNVYFNRRDYESALREIKAVNMPKMPSGQILAAAVSGHLGKATEAKAALAALRAINPALLEPDAARAFVAMSLWDDAYIDHLLEGFKKAITLTEVQRPSPSTGDASIAVLPFSDLSEKKDQDWFCDGIAEEILNALAPLPGLRVAARASAFSLRGKTDDLKSIGEKLNVTTVLEGSVRRAGDRVRITAQLSDTQQGRQLWSERFDRELKDIFDVQEEIARAIVERLRVTITGGAERLVQKTTTNIEAYELMLKGRVFLNRRGPAIVNAIECFERAIALDPNLADAHAGLGDTYRLFLIYGVKPAAEAVPLSRASLERALAIEPDQIEALATLANLAHVADWNYAASAALGDRALARDPSHVRTLAESAITLATSMVDDPSDALKQRILERIRRARALDPLSAWAMALEALVLDNLNQAPEALELANRAVATDPNNFTAHWARLVTLTQMDRVDEAQQAAQPGLAMSGRHPMLLSELATMQSLHGDAAGADTIHRELVERAKTGYVGAASLAVTAAAAGHMADARTFLAQAIAARDSFISFHKLPAFRVIWADPECAAMLRNSALMQGQPS